MEVSREARMPPCVAAWFCRVAVVEAEDHRMLAGAGESGRNGGKQFGSQQNFYQRQLRGV